MRELKRDYIFEFAGMPQGGKSIIVDIISHFLKREGLSIQEYDGGSRHSPLSDADIGVLNLVLACKVVQFVASVVGSRKKAYKIYLLDRGLIDRFIFTEALQQEGKIDEVEAKRIYNFLTLPRLLRRIDGVFIFITSPEMALERESVNKLVKSGGEVMNEKFLTTLHTATHDGYNYAKERMSNVHLINTERENGRVQETAWRVRDYILPLL
jgi:thymidylate kinase